MRIISKLLSKLCFTSLLCTLLPGCATIVHGTRQKVSVTTNPPGASVSDGMTTLQTPATFNLERDRDYILTITKPGYDTETVRVTHVISGAVAGNILAGGLIGWGVDAISGAQWRLEPETLSVNLRQLQANESVARSQKPVDTLEAKLEELSSLKQKNLITEDEYKVMRELTLQAANGGESKQISTTADSESTQIS
jgi:PEGA domain-containing protein